MTPDSPDFPDIQPANPIFGTPDQDAALTPESYQGYTDTCAIRSQQLIMGQFGLTVPQEQLMYEARERGWYNPGQGTSMENVGNLLELHGIHINRYSEANVFNLASELAQGHKVIVGVESEELWRQNPVLNDLEHILGKPPQADHALIVTGIDTSDIKHVTVDIMDPGTGDVCKKYPLEQFLDAWKGSDFFMVATLNPAPANLPEMQNFDYQAGHLHQIGRMSYNDCEAFFSLGCPGVHLIHQFMSRILGFHSDNLAGTSDSSFSATDYAAAADDSLQLDAAGNPACLLPDADDTVGHGNSTLSSESHHHHTDPSYGTPNNL